MLVLCSDASSISDHRTNIFQYELILEYITSGVFQYKKLFLIYVASLHKNYCD